MLLIEEKVMRKKGKVNDEDSVKGIKLILLDNEVDLKDRIRKWKWIYVKREIVKKEDVG